LQNVKRLALELLQLKPLAMLPRFVHGCYQVQVILEMTKELWITAGNASAEST